MSQYTHIYLREKGKPILSLRRYLSLAEKKQGLSEEQIEASYAEVDAYNETARKSFGCELFYLDTTPSRQLEVLPYSEEPRLLSKDILNDILSFYEEEIQELKDIIAKERSQLEIKEKRILLASPRLYKLISKEIEEHKDYIEECQNSLKERHYFYNEFVFLNELADNPSNSNYELVYTNC